MSLSPQLREALPLELRRVLRRGQRLAVDVFRGERLTAPPRQDLSGWIAAAQVSQALGTTPNASAKQHNIALAADIFSFRPIPPGGMFSFWGWLGAPTKARGFQEGRALRNGRLVLESGGGLCQLAGAIYFAGLQAGLCAVERHAHSVDLYTDETRYAPLGSDATVSFGFKDLRLRNPHSCGVGFDIRAKGETLDVKALSGQAIAPVALEFRRMSQADGSVAVETRTGANVIARTIYKRFNSATSASPV